MNVMHHVHCINEQAFRQLTFPLNTIDVVSNKPFQIILLKKYKFLNSYIMKWMSMSLIKRYALIEFYLAIITREADILRYNNVSGMNICRIDFMLSTAKIIWHKDLDINFSVSKWIQLVYVTENSTKRKI